MDAKERRFLEARINEALNIAETRGVPKFVGFLDLAGITVAGETASRSSVKYMLYGGYPEAERVCFGAFPDWCEPEPQMFPITRLRICNKSTVKLSHRDVLGALMSAGIERDTVGDILIGDGDPVVFTLPAVAEHIKAHIIKIASAGVEIVEDNETAASVSKRFEEKSGTVASMRLDCVVSEIADCSRGKAVELIESGMVSVGGLEVLKITAEVKCCDIISVRRMGKFVIDECSRITKKGRIALLYRKYI